MCGRDGGGRGYERSGVDWWECRGVGLGLRCLRIGGVQGKRGDGKDQWDGEGSGSEKWPFKWRIENTQFCNSFYILCPILNHIWHLCLVLNRIWHICLMLNPNMTHMPNVKPYVTHFVWNVNTTLISNSLCCLNKHFKKNRELAINLHKIISRSVHIWNSLTSSIVTCSSISAFKRKNKSVNLFKFLKLPYA